MEHVDRRHLLAQISGLTGLAAGAALLHASNADASGQMTRATVYNIHDFGARGDNVTDDTHAIQAAIDACQNAGGGVVYVPAGGYLIKDVLRIRESNVAILGDGRSTSALNFDNQGLDGLIYHKENGITHQIACFKLQDLSLNGVRKTGGAMLVAKNIAMMLIDSVVIDHCFAGCYLERTNSVTFREVIINPTVPGAFYGVKWCSSSSDDSLRSDCLTFFNTTIQCGYSGADGLIWDGACYTMRVFGLALLSARTGMLIQNTQRSDRCPQFLMGYDIEIDGASSNALRIEGGSDFHFVGCDISNTSGAPGQGERDGDAVVILADEGSSHTHGIYFDGCRIGNCRLRAMICAAKDVYIHSCTFHDASKSGMNASPVVQFVAPASDISISGGRCGPLTGEDNRMSVGLVIDPGVQRLVASGLNFYRCNIAGIANHASHPSVVIRDCIGHDGSLIVN